MSWYSNILEWGKSLEQKLAHENDLDFSKVAHRELSEEKFHINFNLDATLKEILELKTYPLQIFPHSKFGDPPITLFSSKDRSFFIDLYIWTKSHTSIHDHVFRGSFTVLQGQSLASEYSFEKERAMGSSYWGELKKRKIELLRPGDIKPIFFKDNLIHRVLHVSSPTVSLVVRTGVSGNKVVQYDYDFESLASPCHPEGDVIGKLRALKWYLNNNFVPTYEMVDSLLPYSDLWRTLSQYPQANNLLKKIAFSQNNMELISKIKQQQIFVSILGELKTEEVKIFFAVYEHLGEKWDEWLRINLGVDADNARLQLVDAINSLPVFTKDFSRLPLIKSLFHSQITT